jgi:hypothetical protein
MYIAEHSGTVDFIVSLAKLRKITNFAPLCEDLKKLL